jgi:3-carboxy-cis,cis-muconate cycloisomerase
MLENLELTQGLIYAEAISMALAQRIGKPEAHTILEAASRQAVSEHRHLLEVLAGDPLVTAHLKMDELKRLFDPRSNHGAAERFIDRVLATHHEISRAAAGR